MEDAKSGLTQGPIAKELFKLAIPIMASSFLVTAYNITDMFWIGRLGEKAVAGIGVGGMYVWLSNGLASLTRVGGQVNVAQELGRGNRESAKKYVAVALQMVSLFGILFGLISTIFANKLIGVYNLKDQVTFRYAKDYLVITCGFIIFSYLINTIAGLYTAQGDSKTPFIVNLIGLIINMILDPLLIEGVGGFPRLEASGAAIATVLSQAIAVVLIVVFTYSQKSVSKDNLLRELQLFKKYDIKYIKRIVKIGGPIAIQGTLYCAISMVLTKVVAVYGDIAIAVQKVGGQIESISWNTAEGFGSAVNSFSAQNYGAGKMNRVKKGYKISALLLLIWGIIIMILFFLFPDFISAGFFHDEPSIRCSSEYLVIIGLSEPFMCIELLAIGALSGLGRTKVCSVISVLLTALRIPLALCLTRTGLGLNGVWWALTISSVLKGIVLHIAFMYQCNRLKKESSPI